MMGEKVFAPWTDPNETPLIQFKNVTKRFGEFTAIDNQTFDIYEREFFALLGICIEFTKVGTLDFNAQRPLPIVFIIVVILGGVSRYPGNISPTGHISPG